MRLGTIAILFAVISLPTTAISETFTLETSWSSSSAGAIASDASRVWTLTSDGTTVRSYDHFGTEVVTWNTNLPSGSSSVYDRAIGVDGSGLVYVMTATREIGGWVQKFQADGSLISSGPFEFPGYLGFAVDASGGIHGGDESFDDPVALLALGPDGTRYTSLQRCCVTPLVGSGPGSTMVPFGPKCGGPTSVSTSCYSAYYAAATDTRLYVAGVWCNAEGACGQAIRVFGPGRTLLGIIPQYGQISLVSSGTAYVLTNTQVIEKWVSSGITPAIESGWGAIKARWR